MPFGHCPCSGPNTTTSTACKHKTKTNIIPILLKYKKIENVKIRAPPSLSDS